MSARTYARASDVAELKATLDAFIATFAPAQAQPVQASAAAPLYVSDKPRCGIHGASCTRKLADPLASHVPCSGDRDPMHGKLRKSHRHF